MAQSKPVLVNFSSDTYDLPETVDHEKYTVEEVTLLNTENGVVQLAKEKLDINAIILSSDQDLNDDVDSKEWIPVPKVPEIEDTQGMAKEQESNEEATEGDPAWEVKLTDEGVGKKKEKVPSVSLSEEKENNMDNADPVEDCQNIEEKFKPDQCLQEADQCLQEADETESNVLMKAGKTAEELNLSLDRNIAETGKSDNVKVDHTYITEVPETSDNNIDGCELDIDKKVSRESDSSDENNNEIISDLDPDEDMQNEDSFQVDSDRMYDASENMKQNTGYPRESVYINLMKDTLGADNLMHRDSQLTFSDMDPRLSARSETRPQTTSTMREVPGGLRAKANTPASLYTADNVLDVSEEDKRISSGRAASRASREEVFQRAMTLMSNRCTSAREDEDVLFSSREPPFGIHIPEYFYVYQKKPTPMAPLKAWRGFKGNVYFEPMSIKGIMQSNDTLYSLPSTAMSRNRSASRAPTRATTAGMFKKSYRLVNSSPQIAILDKHSIVRSDNFDIEQDLRFIEGIESTGSLAVRPQSRANDHINVIDGNTPCKPKEKRLMYKRDRICKGSNYHNIQNKNINAPVNQNNRNVNQGGYNYYSSRRSHTSGLSRKSSFASSKISTRKQQSSSAGSKRMSNQDLMISGDKFSLPTVMSPILRTNAQFPLHDQRPLMPSPDVYNEYANTPSLDRIHVSLEQMDISDEQYSKEASYDQNDSYPEAAPPFIDVSFKKATANTC